MSFELDRRRFLGLATGGLAGGVFLRTPPSFVFGGHAPDTAVKLGVASYSLRQLSREKAIEIRR